eukprot:1471470-Pyramimonas_sp.AAC.3
MLPNYIVRASKQTSKRRVPRELAKVLCLPAYLAGVTVPPRNSYLGLEIEQFQLDCEDKDYGWSSESKIHPK